MNPNSTFADIEIILRLLKKVERRIRVHRLAHELTFVLSVALIIPITLKVWDLRSPLAVTTVTSAFALCVAVLAGYTLWHLLNRGTLSEAAISIDDRADLYDEMKTACWFITNRLRSDWINAQIRSAATNSRNIDLRRLYPWTIPRMSYVAAMMFLVFAALNFLPLSLNHNWLKLEAAPAGVSPQPDAFVQGIKEGLQQIAKDLEQSEQTQETAEALMQEQLRKAAEELRKLAAQMKQEKPDSQRSTERMQRSLEQASRNSKPGLEKLAKSLRQASEGLKNDSRQTTQEALQQAANQLEGLEQQLREQQTSGHGEQQREAREQQNQKRPGGGKEQKSAESGQSAQSSDKKSERESNGTGQDPTGNAPRQGDPATLEVQLEREKLAGMPLGGSVPDDVEEASKQQLSKLDYRNVKAPSNSTQKDLMNRESIPWEYRSLVRDYFRTMGETE